MVLLISRRTKGGSFCTRSILLRMGFMKTMTPSQFLPLPARSNPCIMQLRPGGVFCCAVRDATRRMIRRNGEVHSNAMA